MKVTIYFVTKDYKEIERIRSENSLIGILNVNGECECDVNSQTLMSLKDEAASGLIQIRNKR